MLTTQLTTVFAALRATPELRQLSTSSRLSFVLPVFGAYRLFKVAIPKIDALADLIPDLISRA